MNGLLIIRECVMTRSAVKLLLFTPVLAERVKNIFEYPKKPKGVFVFTSNK